MRALAFFPVAGSPKKLITKTLTYIQGKVVRAIRKPHSQLGSPSVLKKGKVLTFHGLANYIARVKCVVGI